MYNINNMKILLNINNKALRELLKYTSAETEETAVLTAVDIYLKSRRSEELSDFIRDYEDIGIALKEFEKQKKEV